MLDWLRAVSFAVAAALSTGAAVLSTGAVAQEQYQEGVHYDLIEPAIHTGTSDRVVVTEFFSYGCGHCYNFEPLLESFESRLPEGVVVQRTPVIWNNNPGMKLLAKPITRLRCSMCSSLSTALYSIPFTVSASVYLA